jgi:hypothetical protein
MLRVKSILDNGMLEFVNIKSIRFYDQLMHEHHVTYKNFVN